MRGEAVQLVWGRGKTRIEIERLETELAQQASRAGRAEAEREALRAELDRLGGELAAADQRAQRLTTEHAEHAAAWTLRAEVAERRAVELSDHLKRSSSDLAAARAEVGELTTTLAGVQAALDRAQSDMAAARRTLGADRDHALAELAKLRDQIQLAGVEQADQALELTRRVEGAESRAKDLVNQLARGDADLAAARQEVDQLQGLLRQKTEEARAATVETTAISERRTQPRGLEAARAEGRQEASAMADSTSTPEPATEREQSQPPTNELTDRPNPSRGQRQQPSRRRRGRPSGG
jgi:chromosome segregation ATPase